MNSNAAFSRAANTTFKTIPYFPRLTFLTAAKKSIATGGDSNSRI